jgi:hypothetical protein
MDAKTQCPGGPGAGNAALGEAANSERDYTTPSAREQRIPPWELPAIRMLRERGGNINPYGGRPGRVVSARTIRRLNRKLKKREGWS